NPASSVYIKKRFLPFFVLFVFYSLLSALHNIYVYSLFLLLLTFRRPPISTLFPYTTLFRSKSKERTSMDRLSSFYQMRKKRGFRSEEHTSELQSRFDLVCRLLLEKKKNQNNTYLNGYLWLNIYTRRQVHNIQFSDIQMMKRI